MIPFFHWGVEYTLVPTAFQREIARLAIDAGATLVVGSHPTGSRGSNGIVVAQSFTRSAILFSTKSGHPRRSKV